MSEASEGEPPAPARLRRIHERLDELVPADAAKTFNEKLEELASRDPQAAKLLERMAGED